MKLIILLICMPFVYTELHTLMTTYTGIRGIKGIPQFFAVSTLDGQQMDYYDSITQTLSSRQKWLEEFVFTEMWNEDTEFRRSVQQIYMNNIHVIMSRFNQSSGIHTYQRMYGCWWDNETDESDGFDVYGYDGEDFISLNLKTAKYTTALEQAIPSIQKWNRNREQIEFLLQYYKYECVYWIKYFVFLRKSSLCSAPEVFLLQRNTSFPVSCHVTGFYPPGVMISWMKNGQAHDEDVEITETLPNVDGTFQKTIKLNVGPEDWRKDEYVCVVQHKSGTFQKFLNVDEIKSNDQCLVKLDYIIHIILSMMMMILLVVTVMTGIVHNKKRKGDFEKPSSAEWAWDKKQP